MIAPKAIKGHSLATTTRHLAHVRLRNNMTNWRAVAIGFAVEFVVGVLAFGLPGLGHVAAGLIGGFTAGYLAAAGLWSGAWHGLLAGAIGGIVLASLFGLVIVLVGTIGLGPLGSMLGFGAFAVAMFVAIAMAIDSAIGGLIGGLFAE